MLGLILVSVCYIFLVGAENIAVHALAVLVIHGVHLRVFKLKILLAAKILTMRKIHKRTKWNRSLFDVWRSKWWRLILL